MNIIAENPSDINSDKEHTLEESPEEDGENYLVAFSGGGAKGLVHIGAFHHLHDTGKGIASVAGTSAGAIIAAFIAVGYRPDELLRKDGFSPLWEDIKAEFCGLNFLSDALGNVQYEHLNSIYTKLRNREWISFGINLYGKEKTRNFALAVSFSYIFFLVLLWSFSSYSYISAFYAILLSLIGSSLIAFVSCISYVYLAAREVNKNVENGICSLADVEKIIEFSLLRRIGKRTRSGPVCFGELTAIPLKIVATNITSSEPALFSTEATPDESVSKAVAASICLPYVFPAQIIDGSLHYDGGIVSNLPAWVFEEERLVAPNLRAIAFSVQEADVPIKDTKKSTTIERLFSSLLSAHQSIGLRSLVDLKEIVLKTDFNLLSFRFDREDAARIVQQGQESSAIIDDLYTTIPDLYCSLADQIRKKISTNISDVLKSYCASKDRQSAKRLRVAFAVQEPHRPGLMWIKFSSGFRKSKDTGIMIPTRTSTAGLAFNSEKPVLTIMGRSTEGVLTGPTDGYVRSIIDPKIKWIIGVPINLKEAIVDENGDAREIQRKIVLTVDGFDDIFAEIPSGFPSLNQENWNKTIVDEVCSAVHSVLESYVRRKLPAIEGPSLDELFPRLEDAASKHI